MKLRTSLLDCDANNLKDGVGPGFYRCLYQFRDFKLGKVFFPRLVLPVSAAASGLLGAGVGLAFFVLLKLLNGPSFGLEILTLPVWLGILLIFALGLGLTSAALSVRFPDVQYITPVFVQILFYASPIAYQTAAVPEKWREYFSLNPLAPLF